MKKLTTGWIVPSNKINKELPIINAGEITIDGVKYTFYTLAVESDPYVNTINMYEVNLYLDLNVNLDCEYKTIKVKEDSSKESKEVEYEVRFYPAPKKTLINIPDMELA